jgi:carbon storage regulator
MLVLGRRQNEKILIGDNIVITVTSAKDRYGQVKLGIDAPSNIKILREELKERK